MYTIYTNIKSTGTSAREIGDTEYDLCVSDFCAELVEETAWYSKAGRCLVLRYAGSASKKALLTIKDLPWVEQVCWHSLCDHKTGKPIRPATTHELEMSVAAASTDGGYGIIVVDGLNCFVEE